MNCVPKYDSFWQLWESSPNNPISTYVVTVVPRLSLLAKVSERNKENFVVHIYWSNLPKTVLCSAGVVFVGAEDSYKKAKKFTSYTIFVAKSVLRDFHSKKTMQRLRYFFLMITYDFFHSLKGYRPILRDLSFITWGEGDGGFWGTHGS